jgi:hypothetical protein
MHEYTRLSVDELIALHNARKKEIAKLQRNPDYYRHKLSLLLSDRECLKRLIVARGGQTSGMAKEAAALKDKFSPPLGPSASY